MSERDEETGDGRELDAAVAMNVMGWLPHARNTAHWTDAASVNATDYRVRGIVDQWSPSISMADAWEAVEQLRLLGYDVQLTARSGYNCVCCVAPMNKEFSVGPIYGDAAKMPLAICKAALAVVKD